MAVAPPPPVPTRLVERLLVDVHAERAARRARVGLPPGPTRPSMLRTWRFERNPLPLLLDAYERHGPVFTMRLLHAPIVFMLGPEANHFVTVSHARLFRWRDGSMGDLIPLLGDGMLTIDGDYHRRARHVTLPVFHHDRVAQAVDVMVEETERALAPLRGGQEVDLYAWARHLTLRVAMRALFGLDPDRTGRRVDAAEEFERALAFYGRDYLMQLVRGPRSPWNRMHAARSRLDELLFAEIARRRADPGHGGEDVMSLLLEARDDDGRGFSDREVRDQVMTMLFAGHDTTTSTVAFLFYELAHHPDEAQRLAAEQDEVLGDRPPTASDLAKRMPRLEMAVDETLRLYPPAWVGPRRAAQRFEFAGQVVPEGVCVNYCSWASHRLPHVFPEPDEFRPDRFAPEAKAALPKGAYVPFGGGSRTCIGMRFGLMETRAIAARLLQRFRVELRPGYRLTIRQMPTLSPRGGLPVTLRAR